MRALVILGHPKPESFNHAIARTVVRTLEADGREVVFRDLYRDGFDPLLRAEETVRCWFAGTGS